MRKNRKNMKKNRSQWSKSELGTINGYALPVVLIAMISIPALSSLGDRMNDRFLEAGGSVSTIDPKDQTPPTTLPPGTKSARLEVWIP